jgi:hypothetical protein
VFLHDGADLFKLILLGFAITIVLQIEKLKYAFLEINMVAGGGGSASEAKGFNKFAKFREANVSIRFTR